MIPLGDLDLRQQVGTDGPLTVMRRRQGSVRRTYSGRIHGSSLDMTVVLYQGEGAEEVLLEVSPVES
jgi:hypothetical protein